jgi:hypothetical protein
LSTESASPGPSAASAKLRDWPGTTGMIGMPAANVAPPSVDCQAHTCWPKPWSTGRLAATTTVPAAVTKACGLALNVAVVARVLTIAGSHADPDGRTMQ